MVPPSRVPMDESLFYLGESMPHTSEWLVEQAVPEDAEALAYMHAESFKEAYLGDDEERNAAVLAESAAFMSPDRLRKRVELIHESMLNSDREFYAVVNDDAGIAIGLIYGFKEESLQELSALYINKQYFGSGLAQALAGEFLEWCDRDKPVEVGVFVENARAQKFYQKIGFQATGKAHDSYYEFLPETKMILPKRQGDI